MSVHELRVFFPLAQNRVGRHAFGRREILWLIAVFILGAFLGFHVSLAEAQSQSNGSQHPQTQQFMQSQVQPRIRDKRQNVVPGQLKDVTGFLRDKFPSGSLPSWRAPIDRGYDDARSFNEIDKAVIDGEFDECFDPGYMYPCCYCFPNITALTEYWFPVSKAEVVQQPLKTAYVKKQDIEKVRSQLENMFFPDKMAMWAEQKRNRAIEKASAYAGSKGARSNTPPVTPPIPAQMLTQLRSGISGISDPYLRNPDDTGSGVYIDYHVMAEPYGRGDLYWSRPEVCHYNLPPNDVSMDGNVRLSDVYYSDFPIGFEASRNAPIQNASLTGKDIRRQGLGYDHDGWFFNGGYISEYLVKRDADPGQCLENNFASVKGRTPDDMLSPIWNPNAFDPHQETGCLEKNMGEWVPTRNSVQTHYDPIAALVGSMRGFKLAYYYFPTSSRCQGRPIWDSWGYCTSPFQLDGKFYDFEPKPYTIAFARHPLTEQSAPDAFGAGRALISDKIQITQSKEMPKKCTTLMKYVDELENRLGGGDPTKFDLKGDNPTGDVIDEHDVVVQWRVFRTCPKVTIAGKPLRWPGTNTAVCCPRCACPGPCCCPPDKRL